jgi:hypothetical protein
MPAPRPPDALTATEPRAITARLTFEFSVQTICRTAFPPAKKRTAGEPDIRTVLSNCTSMKRRLPLELAIETEGEAVPVIATEKGRVIG